MYDFLLSADLMVPDPDASVRLLVEKIGLPEPKPTWRQGFDNHAFVAWFARVHPSLAVAPTRLETQGHREHPNPSDPLFEPFLKHLLEWQGPARPMKTHATVLITRRLPELFEKLQRRKVPFRIAPGSKEMDFDRLWIGVTGNDPYYDPSFDGGLVIEVLPEVGLFMPDAVWDDTPMQPIDPKPGEMIRIVSRGFLVQDLDDTLRVLSLNMDWEPEGPTDDIADEGYRRARMSFTLKNSSTFEIMQPTRYECETGRYLATWGPGPYHVRIAVNGVDAKAADLDERGTPYVRLPETSAVDGPRLRVDPAAVEGAIIEFVEWQP